MSQQRRQTRSVTLKEKHNLLTNPQLNKARTKVQQAISSQKYDQALTLLKNITENTHWSACQEALILFNLDKFEKSLKVLRRLLKFSNNYCAKCVELFIRIVEKQQPNICRFQRLIKNYLKMSDLPYKVKLQLEYFLSDIKNSLQMKSATLGDFSKLTKHYEKMDVLFDKVEIVQVEQEYRVARAKQTIQPFEVIIAVPENQMITLEKAKECRQVEILAEEEYRLKSPKHCQLSLFLILEQRKGRDSRYYNYIKCLPRKLDNFPVYYTQDELKELENTSFLSALLRKKKDIKEDYQQILQILPQMANLFNYQEFIWARMVTSSRIFGILMQQKKTDALVPIADMLNHRMPKMTSWYFCDIKRAFIVQNSAERIEKGEEIYDSYGSKCNSRFLLNYGFAVEDNIYNEVVIGLQSQVVGLKKYKTNKSALNIRISMNLNTDQFRMLLSYYRYYVSHSQENEESDSESTRSKRSSFISKDNECEVWKLILETVKERLAQYKTTIRFDEKLLDRKAAQLSFNVKNCILVRLGQKKVLQFYIKMSKSMIEYFERGTKIKDQEWYMVYLRQINHQSFC